MYAVYRAYDKAGRLLYVGCSINPFRRLDDHRLASVWFRSASSISLNWFDDRASALRAEAIAIRTEGPAYNAAGGIVPGLKPSRPRRSERSDRDREMDRIRQRRHRIKIGQGDPDKLYAPSRSIDAPRSEAIIELAKREGVHPRTIRRREKAGESLSRFQGEAEAQNVTHQPKMKP